MKCCKPFGLICVVFAFCTVTSADTSTTLERCRSRHDGGRVLKILPSMSLQAVNGLDLRPGDQVLFARGGVWRGQLLPKSGEPGRPIVYGSFGEGAKPVIEPSYAKNEAADWTNAGDGLWCAESGAKEDIGNIIFDHGAAGCAFKHDRRENVKDDLAFWCDPKTRAVLLKSERNPATRFASLELCEKIHAVRSSGGHDIELDGLWIRYSGAHGVGVTKVARFNVRNCDISWIGGGIQYWDDHGNGVRFGNGIEFWADAEDCTVERNRLWEIWDAALSNQSRRDGQVQRNIRWLGNEVWNSEYSFEYWQSSETSVTDCILVKDNLFRDAGSGWGHRQRWNPNAAHLMLYDNCAKMSGGFLVEGNVFSRSKDTLMRLFNDWRKSMTFRGNIWRTDGESLCRYHGRPVKGLKYLYPMRLDRAHDDSQAEIESQTVNPPRVFAADQMEKFMRFLNDDAAAACPPFVVASLAEGERYEKLHPRFAKAFAFLRRTDLKTLPVGRYEIEKDNCWAMVQNASLKPFEGETQKTEIHAAFFDIQVPLDGPETYGLYETRAVFEPFNADRDIGFAQVKTSPVTLEPGQFAIFSPVTGAHAPCLTTGTPCARRKIVIKVRK